MMKMHKHIARLAILLLLLAACTNRELSPDDGCVASREIKVSVLTDWKGTAPIRQLNFVFYPTDGGEPITFTTPETGFIGELPVGTYQVLAFNTDLVHTTMSGTGGYTTAQVRVNDAKSKDTRADSRNIDSPNNLFAFHLDEFVVEHDISTATVYPDTLTRRLRVSVKSPVKMKALSGKINGAVTERRLHDAGVPNTETGTVRLVSNTQTAKDSLTMQSNIFGFRNPKGTTPYQSVLTVSATLEDGKDYTLHVDVSGVLADIMKNKDIDCVLHMDIHLQLIIDFEKGEVRVSADLTPWGDNNEIPIEI